MGVTEITARPEPAWIALRFVVPGPELGAAGASALVQEALSSVEGSQQAEVLLDLSSVSRMSTGALAILLLLQERLAGMGCMLSLIPPTGSARALMNLYSLEQRFGLK